LYQEQNGRWRCRYKFQIKLAKSIKNSDCTKSKTAGGGAGINFKWDVDMTRTYAIAKFDGRRWICELHGDLPSMDKFDAIGYDDGQRNVNGNKMLKFKSIDVDWYKVEKELLYQTEDDIEDGTITKGDTIEVDIDRYDWEDTMLFKGYVRGKIKQNDVFNVEGNATAYTDYGSYRINIAIDFKATKDMEYWYEDVFESYGDDEW